MTSDVPAWSTWGFALAGLAPWALMVLFLWWLGRGGRRGLGVPGALPVLVVAGALFNLGTVVQLLGLRPPVWTMYASSAAGMAVAFGYLAYQWRRNAATINGPWEPDPETERLTEEWRRSKGRLLEKIAADEARARAGVDAPAADETETR